MYSRCCSFDDVVAGGVVAFDGAAIVQIVASLVVVLLRVQ